jgi:hypothetical protein
MDPSGCSSRRSCGSRRAAHRKTDPWQTMFSLGAATRSSDSWGTYRSASGRWIAWAFCAVMALIGVAGLIQPSLDDRLLGLVWLASAGFLAGLSAWPRLSTGPDRSDDRRHGSHRRLSWSDVDHFGVVDGQGILVASDGRQIVLSAIGGFRFHVREQERLIAALDEDRTRAGQQSRPH